MIETLLGKKDLGGAAKWAQRTAIREDFDTWDQRFICPRCKTMSVFHPMTNTWENPCRCMNVKG